MYHFIGIDCFKNIVLLIKSMLSHRGLVAKERRINKALKFLSLQGSAEEKARAGTVVGLSVNIAALLSVLIQPFMPKLSAELQSQLAAPEAVNFIPTEMYILLPSGHK